MENVKRNYRATQTEGKQHQKNFRIAIKLNEWKKGKVFYRNLWCIIGRKMKMRGKSISRDILSKALEKDAKSNFNIRYAWFTFHDFSRSLKHDFNKISSSVSEKNDELKFSFGWKIFQWILHLKFNLEILTFKGSRMSTWKIIKVFFLLRWIWV